ncbi:hypothetical protein GCM10023185_41580 [Hymenobacter saemangeumensis]|uniref:DUF4386 family protein n=1 Tax=Hymenobacter saemangeumensis TaxID=1084522 RepID=A0ABP8IRD9_9BACT
MRRLLALVFLFLPLGLAAQTPPAGLTEFNSRREALNRQGMNVLGGWALLNVAAGTAGALTADGQAKYFSQMSLGWGAVNLALVAATRLSQRPVPADRAETVRAQLTTENLYLFNAGLDAAYIATGFYLREQAKTQDSEAAAQRSRGYGDALLLQGGFLFLFDGLMYTAQHRHGNQQLYRLLSQLRVGPTGVALCIPIAGRPAM